MRKSLLIMVVVLTAFSVEKVSASLSQNCCCSFPEIREKSLELNVGYRRDNLSWQFQDPSVRFLQTILPVAVDGIVDLLPIDPDYGLGPIASLATGVLEGVLCKNATYHSDWSNLRMINVGGTAKAVTCDNFYARFGGNWAYMVEGKQTTSGIFAGEREFLTKILSGCDLGFSPCKRVCGNTWDVSGAIGYQIRSCDDDFMFTPVLGYAYNKIDMHTNKNEFFNNDPNLDLGGLLPLPLAIEISEVAGGSKTCYKSHWTGPYLGFDAVYRVNCCLDLYTSFEYHWAGYSADSHIRNNFALTLTDADYGVELLSLATKHEVDFKHDACGRGLFWNFGGNYNFCKCWTAGFKFSWVDWKTFKNGRIRAKALNELELDLSEVIPLPGDGVIETLYCKDTKLDQVRWNSYRIEFTLGYDF